MKWIEVKVIFKPKKEILVEEIISNIFETAETGGVVIERPDLDPVEGWEPGPVCKAKNYSVTGYIKSETDAEEKVKKIEKGINALIKEGVYCELIFSTIKEEDWSETWKEFFRPEKLTENITVKPTWRDYTAAEGEMIIEIDPGMAFGTGTHATTGMCINLIEKYLCRGNTFLDIGTGSGILMIAADLLKAGNMSGTDIDDVAIKTAEKNILKNNINHDKFKLFKGNLSEMVNEKFDFVAANILAEIIIELLPDLNKVIKKDGVFVCSGILEEKAEMIVEKMKETGFTILELTKRDSWAAIAGKYTN